MIEKPSIESLSDFFNKKEDDASPELDPTQARQSVHKGRIDLNKFFEDGTSVPLDLAPSIAPSVTNDQGFVAEEDATTPIADADPSNESDLGLANAQTPQLNTPPGTVSSSDALFSSSVEKLVSTVRGFGRETAESIQRANAGENALEELNSLLVIRREGKPIPGFMADRYAGLVDIRENLGENEVIQRISQSDDIAEALQDALQNPDVVIQTLVEQYPDVFEEIAATAVGGLGGGAIGFVTGGPAGMIAGASAGSSAASFAAAEDNAYRGYLHGQILNHLHARGLATNGDNIANFLNSADGSDALDKSSRYAKVIAASSGLAGLVGAGAVTTSLARVAGKLGLNVVEEGGKIVVKDGIKRKSAEFIASTTIELSGEAAASLSVGDDVTSGGLLLEALVSGTQAGTSVAVGSIARSRADALSGDVDTGVPDATTAIPAATSDATGQLVAPNAFGIDGPSSQVIDVSDTPSFVLIGDTDVTFPSLVDSRTAESDGFDAPILALPSPESLSDTGQGTKKVSDLSGQSVTYQGEPGFLISKEDGMYFVGQNDTTLVDSGLSDTPASELGIVPVELSLDFQQENRATGSSDKLTLRGKRYKYLSTTLGENGELLSVTLEEIGGSGETRTVRNASSVADIEAIILQEEISNAYSRTEIQQYIEEAYRVASRTTTPDAALSATEIGGDASSPRQARSTEADGASRAPQPAPTRQVEQSTSSRAPLATEGPATAGPSDASRNAGVDAQEFSPPVKSPTEGQPSDLLRANDLPSDEEKVSTGLTFDDYSRVSNGANDPFLDEGRVNDDVSTLSEQELAAEAVKLRKKLLKKSSKLNDPEKSKNLSAEEISDLQSQVAAIQERLASMPKEGNFVSRYLKNSKKLAGLKRLVSREFFSNAPVESKTSSIIYQSEFASGQVIMENHRRRFQEIVTEVSKGFDNVEAFEAAYKDLYKSIMTDPTKNIRFRLDESILPDNFDPATDPITPEMILYNKDGSIPLTISDVRDPSITSEYAIDARFAPVIEPMIKYKSHTFLFIKDTLGKPRIAQLKQLLHTRKIEQQEKMASMLGKIDGKMKHTAFLDKAKWMRAFQDNKGLDDDVQNLVDQGIIDDTSYPVAELMVWLKENSSEDISFIQPNPDGLFERFLDAMVKSTSLEEFHQNTNGDFLNADGSTPIAIHAALGGFDDGSPLSRSYKSLMNVSMQIFNAQRNIEFYQKITMDNSAHISAVYKSQMGGVNSTEWLDEVRNPRKGSKADARRQAYLAELEQEVRIHRKDLKGNPSAIAKAAQILYDKEVERLDTTKRAKGVGNPINIFKFEAAGEDGDRSAGGSIFGKQAKLSDVKRAWMGEVEDVGIAFSHMQKMFAEYKAQANYAIELTKDFADSDKPLLFRSQQQAIDAGYFNAVPIQFPDIYNSNSLMEMYAAPQLEDFLLSNSIAPMTNGAFQLLTSGINQTTKVALVLLNPPLAATNAISNMAYAAAALPFMTFDENGNTKIFQFIAEGYLDILNTIQNIPADVMAEAQGWVDQAVSGAAPLAGDIEAQQRMGDFFGYVGDIIDKGIDKAKRPIQEARKGRGELDPSPSSTVKVPGSSSRQRAQTMAVLQTLLINMHRGPEVSMQKFVVKVYHEYAINQWGMSDAEARKFAKERLRTAGMNILNNPKFVSRMRALPLSTFIGWMTASLKTIASAPRDASRMHKMDVMSHGKKRYGNNFDIYTSPRDQVVQANKDALKLNGSASRAVTSAAIAGAAPAAFTSALLATGSAVIDLFKDELPGEETEEMEVDEEALRGLMYPNVRNRDLKILSISADGRFIKYIDQTRMSSVGTVQEVYNAARRADFADDASQATASLLEPFLGPFLSLGLGTETVFEAMTGFDRHGNNISPEGADVSERAVDALQHLWDGTFNTSYLQNRADGINQIFNPTAVSEKTGERTDIANEFLQHAGLKIVTHDNAGMLKILSQSSLRNIDLGKRELADSIIKRNIVPKETVINKLRAMHDVYEKEMGKILQYKNHALKHMSPQVVHEYLVNAGLSDQEAKNMIEKNQTPVFKLGDTFASTKIKNLQNKTPGSAANQNLAANAQRAKLYLNNLTFGK